MLRQSLEIAHSFQDVPDCVLKSFPYNPISLMIEHNLDASGDDDLKFKTDSLIF